MPPVHRRYRGPLRQRQCAAARRGKLSEYKGIASIGHIVIIDPEQALITLWSRTDGTWGDQDMRGLDAILDLPSLSLSVPLTDLYARVAFPPRPRLIT